MSDPYIGESASLLSTTPPGLGSLQRRHSGRLPIQRSLSLLGPPTAATANYLRPADPQSRVAVGTGQGLGLSSYSIGQTGGTENTTLLANNLPPHAHTIALSANNTTENVNDPTNAYSGLATDSGGNNVSIHTETRGTANMAP